MQISFHHDKASGRVNKRSNPRRRTFATNSGRLRPSSCFGPVKPSAGGRRWKMFKSRFIVCTAEAIKPILPDEVLDA
ncbi:MAG TPA: hypothetical protein EYP56_04140 [Planctomycetaceae bacterium]|nr:hypothetical protein [Planctomycetaceae bacterium]HIQ23363.1 hypothetical protein [Planctomycetota bacterium]